MTSPCIEFEELLMRLNLRDVSLIVPASKICWKFLVELGETDLQVIDCRLPEKVGDFGAGFPGRSRKLFIP